MAIVLTAIAALVALVIAPQVSYNFDVIPKVAILILGISVLLVFSKRWTECLGALMNTQSGRLYLAALALQFAVLALTTALSSHPALSAHGTSWRRFGLLTQAALILYSAVLAGWFAIDRKNVSQFMKVAVLVGAVTAVYGVSQYFGLDPLLPGSAYHVGEGTAAIVRPPSTFGHAGYFATFQVYAVFLAAALLLQGKRAAWVGVFLSTAAIVLSGTRSAMLGLAAGGFVLAYACRGRFRPRHAVAGLVSIAALVGFYFSPAGLHLRGRMHWIAEDPLGGSRLSLWRDSVRMAGDRPLQGFGPETFAATFPRYQSLELARARPDIYQESPHNIFLDALVEEGIGGLLALTSVCVLALAAIRRAPMDMRAVGAGFVGGLVSQQFLCFTLPTALFFYAVAGMLVSQAPRIGERTFPSWIRYPVVAAALLLFVFGARLTCADAMMARAKWDLEGGRFSSAVSAYEIARQWQPAGVSNDLYFSRAMLELSQRTTEPTERFASWQQAMSAAVRAAQADNDRSNALVNLAGFQSTTNDSRAVERSLLAAADESPNWYRPPWLLARLYILTGRNEDALARARAAAERNGGHNPEVLQTLKIAEDLQTSRK